MIGTSTIANTKEARVLRKLNRQATDAKAKLAAFGVHVSEEYLAGIAEALGLEEVQYALRTRLEPHQLAILTARRLLAVTLVPPRFNRPPEPPPDTDAFEAARLTTNARPVLAAPASCRIETVEWTELQEIGEPRLKPVAGADLVTVELAGPFRKISLAVDLGTTTARQWQELLRQLGDFVADAKKARASAGSPLVAELERLAGLKESGALTEREFKAAKRELLAGK